MDEVRRGVGIVPVIEQHVPLKRAGRTLKGLCPFHSEKTPSFHVDDAKGFFHCFGCHAGGDVFKFVMLQEALTFPEAVRSLAARAGLAVPERGTASPEDARRSRLLAVNQSAQEVFADQLAQGGRSAGAREALAYLQGRGIGTETVTAFGLGYAPESWDFLLRRLADFATDDIIAAGVAVAGDRGRGAYDRFRGRVTFPIRAVSERVLAFGGRIIGQGEPKYLNSPETPVYSKGRHLYGLERARAAIRRADEAVLVEGYLDCIALHAAGIDTAVAVLGTALTVDQAQLLARFARRVVINFDGDAAGIAATRRSLEVLLAEGLDVRVVVLPNGQDPDDHVRSQGAESYRRLLDGADGGFQYLVKRAATEHDLSTPAGRVAGLADLVPFLAGIRDRVLRSELTDVAAHGLKLRADLVHAELRSALRRQGGRGKDEAPVRTPEVVGQATHAERSLLSWMLASEDARECVRQATANEALSGLALGPAFQAVLARAAGPTDVPAVIESLEDEWLQREVARLAVGDESADPLDAALLTERVASFVLELGVGSRADAKRRKAEVDEQLMRAIELGDDQLARQLMAEATELARTIHG